MSQINKDRRRWLAWGGLALGLSVLPQTLLAATTSDSKAPKKKSTASRARTLYVKNINTGETIKSTYFNGQSYNNAELKKLDHIFRDRRTNQHISLDPKLYDKIFTLQSHFGSSKAVQLICGYRSPATNSNMRSSKKGVAKNSYHTLGKAADIRIEGVSLTALRNEAMKLKSGGVGYYPASNFVHVDTGPVRDWKGS